MRGIPKTLLPGCIALLLSFAAAGRLAALDFVLNGAGAKIYVDFSNLTNDEIYVTGLLPAVQNQTFAGVQATVSLGPVTRKFKLDADGHAQGPTEYFEIHTVASGMRFTMSASGSNLDAVYAGQGLANASVQDQPLTMNVDLVFDGSHYSTTLTGEYTATVNQSGLALLGDIEQPKPGKKPVVHVKTITATPNPLIAGGTVLFKGDLSLDGITGDIHGHVAFGDGSPLLRAAGKDFVSMLKKGVAHAYAADGVYVARVVLSGENEIIVSRLFILVGRDRVVNSLNGLVTSIRKTGGGNVTIDYDISGIPGGALCSTVFKDFKNVPPGVPLNGTDPAAPQLGASITRTFFLPGVYVATVQVLDANKQVLCRSRKTISIGNAGLKPASELETRDAPATIDLNFSTMGGKFFFNAAKPDQVMFAGSLALPPGYMNKNPSGNEIEISMGNVLDTVRLDAKGHFLSSANNNITKFTLSANLKNGIAAGGELAKIAMTMTGLSLSAAGYESDGVTLQVRSDEQGMSSVPRMVQVHMLVGGQDFQVVAPVTLQLNTDNLFGAIKGRN